MNPIEAAAEEAGKVFIPARFGPHGFEPARFLDESELPDYYVGKQCTVNGHPAVITGARNLFASIVRLDDGGRWEWAWKTVARVMEKRGGKFET